MQPKAPPASALKEIGKPLDPATQVTRVRFALNGRVLAAACFDGKVRLWDTTGQEPAEQKPLGGFNGWVTALTFGVQQVFAADSWGRLSAWRLGGPEPVAHWTAEAAHDGWVRSIAFDARALAVASCGRDGFVRVWDRARGKKWHEFELKTDLLSVCFGPNGKTVLAGDLFGVVREVEIASGKVVRTFEAKELYKLDRIQDVGGVKCLLLSPDGKALLVGGAEPKTGGFVQCVPLLIAFDYETGKRRAQYKGANDNEGYVTDLAWHPDGFVIFTTSGQPGQGKFHCWKPGTAAPFLSGGKLPNCHSVALHPDGARIAVSATNANSSGNGRVKGAGGGYPENTSPIQLWTVPKG
ncbi:MAG TPA: hypothetical protein VGE74_10905 [Gemmata sp.]